ncbi:hypothetical protein HMPREF3196_00606 [Bifidobacterium bifidum]|uniref:Uncharacterized protein n=1 Tax=Bifidobacterium bifidum TaxID=1681 RepID=A0A133KR25_BIFBI|nr:hypothetical protein HMPREF3196_00606 [Bifidobacterium bifidum]
MIRIRFRQDFDVNCHILFIFVSHFKILNDVNVHNSPVAPRNHADCRAIEAKSRVDRKMTAG